MQVATATLLKPEKAAEGLDIPPPHLNYFTCRGLGECVRVALANLLLELGDAETAM